jgi:uncharacterized phiE125 gp8 family phage protein
MTVMDGCTYLSHAVLDIPAAEPVTIAEARAHSHIDHTCDDAVIAAQLIAAREYVEAIIKSPLMQRTFRLRLDRFPATNQILLPAWPARSISGVQYVDNAGTTQVFAESNYELDGDSSMARVLLRRGSAWPSVYMQANNWGASVTYVAGYLTAAEVPQALKQAILLVFGHWYDNLREAATAENLREAPHSVDALCKTFVRARWFA